MQKRDWSEKDLVNKWRRKFSPELARSLPWDVLTALTEGLSADTKLPKDILLGVIQRRDVSGLFTVASNLDVTVYTSADLLLQDRLIVELFSKFTFEPSPFNKREKAQLRFAEAEVNCREANFRVSRSIGLTNDHNRLIHEAIRIIERVLGEFDVNEMLTSSRFGPGSSLCVKGPFTTEYFKLCETSPTVSSDAFPYADALLNFDNQWKAHLLGVHPFDVVGPFSPASGQGIELSITDYNKATFVPKNAKTERSIAIEPYFNVYFQLGVGGMIRRRLKRVGINLDSQERNQALAFIGSQDGSLATIDFSMASDTISLETVRLLLPAQWFDHLDRLRSKTYMMDGQTAVYSKFSSMGNGFTFELETLIFYALALACCADKHLDCGSISVFGDDVIIPTGAVESFISLCNYLGFTINEDKSFADGFFRESCGEDYLKGNRVRPVFCKELTCPADAASLANRLLELNNSVGAGSRLNSILRDACAVLHSRIPRDVRQHLVGPPSQEYDGYIHTTCLGSLAGSGLVRWDRHLFCWRHPVVRFSPKKLKRSNSAAALWLLRGLRNNGTTSSECLPKLYSLGSRTARISDFISENVPREITGRKIGEYTLGHSLVWSLGAT